MKVKKGFTLREVGGESIIIANDKENVDFTRIISLNKSAAKLWKAVIDTDFTVEDLAKLLVEWYSIGEDTALNDSKAVSEAWINAGIVE